MVKQREFRYVCRICGAPIETDLYDLKRGRPAVEVLKLYRCDECVKLDVKRQQLYGFVKRSTEERVTANE